MNGRLDHTGGAGASRGYLAQALVALLKIARGEFTQIRIEPPIVGENQFDFVWHDAHGVHAVQVKSTKNEFTKPDVQRWANKLLAARTREECTLILVGNYHTALHGIDKIGSVTIEKKNLDLDGLMDQAAHHVGFFIEAQDLDGISQSENKRIAEWLITKLLLSGTDTEGKTLTHDAFVALLRSWVRDLPPPEQLIDISRIIKYAPKKFLGREDEITLLNNAASKVRAAESPRPHMLTFVALGGEGKTSLVAKWAAGLADQQWQGWQTVFAWSFYRQGTREQTAGSSDLFLKEALTFFGASQLAESPQRALEKGKHLAKLVGARRSLLILDGVEPLQYGPTSQEPGKLKDKGLAALLGGLAANNRGLCLVTTRYSIPDLNFFTETTSPDVVLQRLSTEAGVALLASLGVLGSQEMLEGLVEKVKGHALTLNLLGTFLRDRYEGRILEHDRVDFTDVNKEQGGHAFRMMDAYVEWFKNDGEKGKRSLAVLRLLGLFDRPATADCLAALLREPVINGLTAVLINSSETQQNLALRRLEEAKLITVNRDSAGNLISLDAHPLVREYFAEKLRGRKAWRPAHRRLYEHLFSATPDMPEPTLEDLQPLYQAVAHGCQAGMEEEAGVNVYFRRIMRGANRGMNGPSSDGFYSTRKLGAFSSDLGVLAFFFKRPWDRISSALSLSHQAKVFALAGFYLRAVGRLPQALATTTNACKIAVKQEEWGNAARFSSDLSELDLTVGQVAKAVRTAKRSVSYADKIIDDPNPAKREDEDGRKNWPMFTRAVYANALHQAGRREEADQCFREAECLQEKSEAEYKLLYCVQGSNYCDLLLAAPERAAWKVVLNGSDGLRRTDENVMLHVKMCDAVARHATITLEWVTRKKWILDMALDQLNLGRARLYSAILQGTPLEDSRPFIQEAVEGLANSGQQDDLPRGLLTRAWLRFLLGQRTGSDSAQRDLDEAWEIAERGPMALFMVDIHLHRARLFFRQQLYPWNKSREGGLRDALADLKAAEVLIKRCGYHRRDAELADAKHLILRRSAVAIGGFRGI